MEIELTSQLEDLKKSVTDATLRGDSSTKEIANITQQRQRLKADYFEDGNMPTQQTNTNANNEQQAQPQQTNTNANPEEANNEEKQKELENVKMEETEPTITSNIDGKIQI